MPLFGHRAPTPDQLAGYVPVPPKLRVLRADGQRIDLTSRTVGQLLTATRQPWQETAFDYRDMIGEVRYAQQLRARAVARCRFYIAEARPWPQDPIPLDGDEHSLDRQLAADAVTNFNRIPFDHDPDGFTARLDENLGLVGEVWTHIDRRDGNDTFHVRSVSEISVTSDGRVTLNGLPGSSTTGARQIDPDGEDLLRLWRPHPQWGQLADAPMRALLDTAEAVVLAGREQRAAARSRLAGNGILLLPEGMSMVRTRTDDDDLDDDSIMSDTFMADFTEAMLAPIRDDGDAQAVVPIVLRGNPEDLEKVRHVMLQRADADKLIEREAAALLRMLRGLDVQPEQVEGSAGLNHWTSWQVDARAVRDQIQPAAETIASCMRQAFMRPALESLGHRDLSRITIAVDTSPLTENPNRGQDARDAHAAFVISDEALRRELGFDDEDKPGDEEVLRRLAASGRLPVVDTAEMLGLRREPERERITVQGETVRPSLPAAEPVRTAESRPVARPGEVTPERATPVAPTSNTPPGPVVAAATDPTQGWRVDADASRRLADIDAALTERVSVAAEAAVQRVLERAGARVRTAAGRKDRDKALAASLVGLDTHLIPATLGREQVEAFVPVADLITDSYDRLHTQVDGWLADAATHTADAVCAVLGLDPRDTRGRAVHGQVVTRLGLTAAQAWPILAAALDEAAEDGLFDPDPDGDEQGETSPGLVPVQAITDALAAAGGETPALVAAGGYGGGRRRRQRRPVKRKPGAIPTTGPATGPVARDVIADQGAVLLGWTWQYRPELSRATFDPHKQLDGQTFTSWRDPILATSAATSWVGDYFHPRDHRGCRCTASPSYAHVEDPESVMAQALRDAHGDPSKVLFGGADTPAGTPRPDTTDLRRRVSAAVDAMRTEHVTRNRKGARR